MNGMIFAAGLGTRLAPLTNSCPKALVKVGNVPLLEHAIRHFAYCGVDNIVVNVHHFADQIVDFISSHHSEWNCDIVISDESDLLLDTGGGLAKALPLFANDGPVVVGNADVFSNAPLSDLIHEHRTGNHDATLFTSTRTSSRHLQFDVSGRLSGWENVANGEKRICRNVIPGFAEAFNGFHVINQSVIRQMLPVRPLPVISAYLDLANNFDIHRLLMPDGFFWFDVGTVQKLAIAEDFWLNNNA